MNIFDLIKYAPSNKENDKLADWFAECEKWAKENNYYDVESDAQTGLTFIGTDYWNEKQRTKILARLKVIRKGYVNMDETRKIFIVHGHDEEMKEKVARIIEKLNFEPIILSEQPNCGKTIIEKLESYSDVRFAIVIYSPDDSMSDGELRGRQNVVFEHGLFIGKLGRQNVMCIRNKSVVLPGDIDGIVYTSSNELQKEIIKELKSAGLDVDANLLYQ